MPAVQIVDETGSTNADLLEAARAGYAVDGRWLVARTQSAGKGRIGREWQSGLGNFHGSVAIALRPADPPAHTLALVLGIAMVEAITAIGQPLPDLKIKWPNDIVIGSAKLAGILLERSGDWVVAGVGCNLATAPKVEGRSTAALTIHGIMLDVPSFAEILAQSCDRELERWRSTALLATIARWSARALPRGTAFSIPASPASAQPGAPALTGTFERLEQDGAFILRAADGSMHSIMAGDVDLIADRDDR